MALSAGCTAATSASSLVAGAAAAAPAVASGTLLLTSCGLPLEPAGAAGAVATCRHRINIQFDYSELQL